MQAAGMTTNRLTSPTEKTRRGTGSGQYWNYAMPIAVVTLLSTGSIFLPTDPLARNIQFTRSTSAGASDKPYATVSEDGSDLTPEVVSASEKLHALRRMSGLTWEQIATLFNVDRRSVHLWANGNAMHPKNEEKLGRILSVVLKIDRGFASMSRALLTTPTADGQLPLDMLAAGKFNAVVDAVGKGPQATKLNIRISAEERAHRRPLSPLLQAEAERADEPPILGPVRAFNPIKAAKRDA